MNETVVDTGGSAPAMGEQTGSPITPEATAPIDDQANITPPETGGEQETSFSIPEEFASDPFFEGAQGFGDLKSKYENLTNDFNQMKGKKGIPSEHNAEEWGKVLENLPPEAKEVLGQLTAPKMEAPEEYKFDEIADYKADEGENEMFANAFKKHNLSQDIANDLRNDLVAEQKNFYAKHVEKVNSDFDKLADKTWGADKEAKVAELGAKFAQLYKGTGVDDQMLSEALDNKLLVPILQGIESGVIAAKGDPAVPGYSANATAMTDQQLATEYKDAMNKASLGDRQAIARVKEMDEKYAMQINRALRG